MSDKLNNSNSSTESFDPVAYKKGQSSNIIDEPTKKPEMVLRNFARTYEQAPLNGYQKLIQGLGTMFGTCGMFCCLCTNPYQEVSQGEVGLVQTFGALTRTVEPGLSYVNTWSEKLTRVSIKINVREIPAQTCFTKDNVSITITSVVYYNIIDPMKAIFDISDINQAIVERTQTTLRDVIGGRVLQDVVEKREEVAATIEHIIAKTAADWGVNVESILIKDLVLPQQVQDSLSKATEARRIGEAKIINAKSEVIASRLYRKSADILSSKAAMNIRFLDTLIQLGKTANSKVIFLPPSSEIDRMVSNYNDNTYEKSKIVESDDEDQDLDAPMLQDHLPSSSNRTIIDTVAMQEAMRD
ncbi:putative band 7 family protein R614 [Candida tropicalis]